MTSQVEVARMVAETACKKFTGKTALPVVPFREPEEQKRTSATGLFQDSLLEQRHLKRTSKPAELLVALVVHVAIVGGPILAGLYYTDSLDMRAFTTTVLVAPPPPPPPPAAPANATIRSQAPKRVFEQGKLLAPTYIPKQVAVIKEAPLEADVLDGAIGGVPGGVPGGQLGGVIGGIVGSASQTRVPVPPAVAAHSRTPIRVGGKIRPPHIVVKPAPTYPVLAKATKTQGVVEIDAVIDSSGNVVEMRVVSGPPLLIQAALEAVNRWKFEPTYLNEEPIAVQLVVTVTFQLDQ